MPFDPLTWALGYSLSKVANGLLGVVFSDDLPRRLAKVAETWAAEQVDVDPALHPEALFSGGTGDGGSARLELRATIEAKRVPEAHLWRDALVEHWRVVGTRPDVTAFFSSDEQDASSRLAILAGRLSAEMGRDADHFRTEIIARTGVLIDSSRRIEDHLAPSRPRTINELVACERVPSLRLYFGGSGVYDRVDPPTSIRVQLWVKNLGPVAAGDVTVDTGIHKAGPFHVRPNTQATPWVDFPQSAFTARGAQVVVECRTPTYEVLRYNFACSGALEPLHVEFDAPKPELA
jgi:hypothetical protein